MCGNAGRSSCRVGGGPEILVAVDDGGISCTARRGVVRYKLIKVPPVDLLDVYVGYVGTLLEGRLAAKRSKDMRLM